MVVKIEQKQKPYTYGNIMFWNDGSERIVFDLATDVLFDNEDLAMAFINALSSINLCAVVPVYITGFKS